MRMGSYVQYTDGEIVFEEGSLGKQVYFIISGKVEVSQQISGRKLTMAELEKGDFFGEMAPLSNAVRSMTMTAVGELHLYELSANEMFQYMRSNPEIMKDVYISLAKRLQNTNLKVKRLSLKIVAGEQSEEIKRLKTEMAEKDKQIKKLQRQIESLREKSPSQL